MYRGVAGKEKQNKTKKKPKVTLKVVSSLRMGNWEVFRSLSNSQVLYGYGATWDPHLLEAH